MKKIEIALLALFAGTAAACGVSSDGAEADAISQSSPIADPRGAQWSRQPEYGFNAGKMDNIFTIQAGVVSIRPEAQVALAQAHADGFRRIALMEPFARNFLYQWPSRPVAAITLLQNLGFSVLVTLNGSPFFNDDTQHPEDNWVYRFFPGDDVDGADDDGGISEHIARMHQFMAALKAVGAIGSKLSFELFDEPNASGSFWGTYPQWESLLRTNIGVVTDPQYGVSPRQIQTPGMTSKLMLGDPTVLATKIDYWNFAANYSTNSLVNRFAFSFNWYPVSSTGDNLAADIALPSVPRGSWITGTNVTAWMSATKLPLYRAQDTFKTKMTDIISYARTKGLAGIYFFNLKNEDDLPSPSNRLGTGFFSASGCPRYEYLQLLQVLNRPVPPAFGTCPFPTIGGL